MHKSKFNSLEDTYSFTFFPGGLGESSLLEPQCFCTDLNNVSESSIIKVYDSKNDPILGYCQKIHKCVHCIDAYKEICKLKILK